jgi:hypothetical protein
MQALIVSKPNHACVFSAASSNSCLSNFDSLNRKIINGLKERGVSIPTSSNSCLSNFDSLNRKIINGLKERGVSIPDEVVEVYECTKKPLPPAVLSTTSFLEVKTSCVLMEHGNILGILCFNYFSPDQCIELLEKGLYIYKNGGNVKRSLLKKSEMVMCGYTINTQDNKCSR